MTRLEKTAAAVITVAALGAGWAVERMLSQEGPDERTELVEAGIILLPQGRAVPTVSMTNQDGQAVAMDQLKGTWSLLFFGYTFCPDICPTTLAQLREIKRKLSPEITGRLRVYLVSVDPHRDTPEQLKNYLSYFDPEFVGLTAPEDVLMQLSTGLSIPYLPADTSKPNYTVQHSGNLAVIGPDARLRGFIRAPFDSSQLLRRLPQLVKGS